MIPYQDWIVDGPGNKFLYSPGRELYCLDTEPPTVVGVVPMQYRNDELSFFLIAAGLVAYPWNYPAEILAHFPKRLRYHHESDSRTIIRERPDIGWRTELNLPPSWAIHQASVFGFDEPIVSNNSRFFAQQDDNVILLSFLDKQEDFVMVAHIQPLLHDTLERHVNEYLFDDILVTDTNYTKDADDSMVYVSADVIDRPVSLIIFAVKRPPIGDVIFHTILRIFALTSIENKVPFIHQLQAVVSGDNWKVFSFEPTI